MSTCYIPRICIDSLDDSENKNIVMKIPYKSCEMSLELDSNFIDGDLTRTNIRVYTNKGDGKDITNDIFPIEHTNIGSAENIKIIMEFIDNHYR